MAFLFGYAVVLLSIGGYFVRRRGGPEQFFLGGRNLSSLQVFGTTFSTFFGTGLVFTLSAFGYRFGVGAFVLPGAAVLGMLLLSASAPRIKAMSDRTGAITLPAMMDDHWSDRTQTMAALVTAGLFTGTLAANLLVVGDVLQFFLDVRPAVGIAALAVLVVGYTVLGGFPAVVWTDVVQTVLIVAVLVLLLSFLALQAGSAGVVTSLPESHLDPSGLPTPVLAVYLFVGVFAFFGSQDLFQRVFAARDATAARRGLLTFTAALVVVGTVAIGLGVVARATLPAVASDRALLHLADAVAPAGLFGVVIVGVLALANSDADSQLLTVASNVTQDLVPADRRIGHHRWAVVDRLAVAVIGTAAALAAIVAPSLTALFGALGAWFAVLGFVVVASLFWDRTSDSAAFWGLTVGFLAPLLFVLRTGAFQAAPVVGLVPAVSVVGVVSMLTGRER
jgi:Na+/proline symporter